MRARRLLSLLALTAVVGGLSPAAALAQEAGDGTAPATASLGGRLTSAAGTPLAGVCAQALTRSGDVAATSRSDSDGRYSVPVQAGTNYRLRFQTCGWPRTNEVEQLYYPNAGTLEAAAVVSATAGQQRSDLDAVLVRLAQLTGVVQDEAGARLDAICVTARDAAGRPRGEAYTGPDGGFALDRLRAGEYTLRFEDCAQAPEYASEYFDDAFTEAAAQRILVDAEVATSTAVTGTLGLGRRITGTLTAPDGAPAAEGTCVSLFDAGTGDHLTQRSTDARGQYAFGGLRGDYKLAFGLCGGAGDVVGEFYDDAPDLSAARVLTVHTEDVVADAVLERLGTLSGQVRDDDGNPLETCVVITGPRGTQQAWTHQEGRFSFRVLPGDYRVNAGGCYGQEPVRWHPDAASEQDAAVVTVASGATVTGIDVVVARPSVSGTVTDVDGAPVAGVCVSTQPFSGTTATTEEDGTYVLELADPGSYEVRFDPCGGDSEHRSTTRTVQVADGQELTGIDVTLARLAGVSGTVRDSAGLPLERICVSTSTGGYGQTGADGSYRLRGASPGAQTVSFFACSGAGGFATTRKTVTVPEAGVLPDVDAVMLKRPTLSGRVVDAEGQPVSGVCVSASAASGGGFARTGADGRYAFSFESAGSVSLHAYECPPSVPRFESSSERRELEAEEQAVLDLVLRRIPTLSGVVQGPDGSPLEGMCVTAESPQSAISWPNVMTARTGPTGEYRITHLQPGTYQVSFSDCDPQGGRRFLTEWHLDARSSLHATPVTIAAEEQAVLGVTQLARAGRVLGTVTDAVTDKPLASVCVAAHDRAGEVVATGVSAADGTYVLGGLPTASYRLRFASCGTAAYETEWHAGATSLASATPVAVTAGTDVIGVHADLRALARVAGTVTDGDGAGVAGICVIAVDAAGAETPTGRTDVNGDFRSGSLVPGEYRFRFDDCAQPVAYATRWLGATGTRDGAAVVALAPGATVLLPDQALTPAAPPGVPTSVRATAVGADAARVTWSAAADNGSSVTGYRATASPGGATCTTGGALGCDVTGLTTGTRYTFTVTATNGVGTGSASAPSPAVVPAEPDVDAPTVDVTSGPAANTRATGAMLAFVGEDPGRPEAQLRYRCSLDGAAYASCTSPVTWSGLAEGVHTARVVALDEAGNRSSVASRTWRVDTTTPTVTTSPVSGFTTATTVGLSYVGSDSGSGIADYDVRYRSAAYDGTFGSYVQPSTSTRDWTGTTSRSVSLPAVAGTTYCLSTRSRDKAGNVSSWSAERCTGVALDDASLTAGSGWSTSSSTSYYQGSARTTSINGAVLTRTGVTTRHLALVATTCATCGTVGVYWNGTLVKQVSLVSSTTLHRQVLPAGDLGAVRSGTLTVKSLSTARSTVDGVGLRAR